MSALALGAPEPSEAARWPVAVLVALLLEAALLGAILTWARHTAAPPQRAPLQIVLEAPPAPRPAPKPPAPVVQPPKPQPQPTPKPQPHRVVHRAPPPRPQPQPLTPPPPAVQPPPAPLPDTRPAMPVAAPTPPAPPAPTPPVPDPASVKASFEAQLRQAIQAAVRYPQAARLMRLSGRALVAFSFVDGHVDALRIVTSSGTDLLDHAALDAVRSAAYPDTPPSLQHRPLQFTVWVRFRMNDE